MFTSNLSMKKNSDLCDFDHVMNVCTGWADLNILDTADPLGISHKQQSLEFTRKGKKMRKPKHWVSDIVGGYTLFELPIMVKKDK